MDCCLRENDEVVAVFSAVLCGFGGWYRDWRSFAGRWCLDSRLRGNDEVGGGNGEGGCGNWSWGVGGEQVAGLRRLPRDVVDRIANVVPLRGVGAWIPACAGMTRWGGGRPAWVCRAPPRVPTRDTPTVVLVGGWMPVGTTGPAGARLGTRLRPTISGGSGGGCRRCGGLFRRSAGLRRARGAGGGWCARGRRAIS